MRSSPHLQKRYRGIIVELSLKKAANLLALAERRPGKVAKLTRRWRENKISQLRDILEKLHLPQLRKWIEKNTSRAEVRFRGALAKNDKAIEVKDRLERHWRRHKHLAYVSFRGKKCLKVGRSDRGLARIANQWANYYFRDATRVVVFFPKQRKKKTLSALECALTHVYQPYHLYHWPALSKYREKCPACKDMKGAQHQVKKLFPA